MSVCEKNGTVAMYKVYVSSTCSVQSMRIGSRGRCAVPWHDFSLLFARFQLVRPNGWWMLACSQPMCSFLLEVEGLMNEGRIEKSWRNVWSAATKFACYDRTNVRTLSIPFVYYVWLTSAFHSEFSCISVSTWIFNIAKLIFNVKSHHKMKMQISSFYLYLCKILL